MFTSEEEAAIRVILSDFPIVQGQVNQLIVADADWRIMQGQVNQLIAANTTEAEIKGWIGERMAGHEGPEVHGKLIDTLTALTERIAALERGGVTGGLKRGDTVRLE